MTQRWTGLILTALLVGAAGCASGQMANVPPGTAEADKFLYERGQAAVGNEKWVDAREYFRNIVDNYPQSPFRPDAKLALGDTPDIPDPPTRPRSQEDTDVPHHPDEADA